MITKNLHKFLILFLLFLSLFIISCNRGGKEEDKCSTNEDCELGFICEYSSVSSNLICIEGCDINRACPDDKKCTDNRCVKPIEECIDDSGCPYLYTCDTFKKCIPKSCKNKTDCGIGSICKYNICIIGCETNNDCDSNQQCLDNQCKEDICVPNCEDYDCGDDGCGETCGICNEENQICNNGLCEIVTPPTAICNIEINGNSIGDYVEVEPAIDRGASPPSIITLDASQSFDPNGEKLIYLWEKISAPSGSVAVAKTPTFERSNYFVDLSGEHKLRLIVTNESGLSSSCEVTANGITSNALHIELFWDKSGDLDLHLKNFGTDDSGWGTLDDCHWQNCKSNSGREELEWGEIGEVNNPRLDRDDIAEKGPENINIAEPQITPIDEHYVVGVRNYSHSGSPTATVRIFCNGSAQLEYSMNLPTAGSSFWWVAEIEWLEMGCNINPINTIGEYPGASSE